MKDYRLKRSFIIGSLRQAIGRAVKWDLLSKNVMERVTPLKRVKPKISVLVVSEVQQLLEAARGTD